MQNSNNKYTRVNIILKGRNYLKILTPSPSKIKIFKIIK